MFRLSTRAMLWLALYALALYLLPIAGASDLGEWRLEVAFAVSFAAVLTWFAWISGYYSHLRQSLSESNRRLEQAVKTIEEFSIHDELTGVHNRRHLIQVLGTEQARLDRGGPAMSVAIVDLDHFKRINDTYGHPVGDEVLKAVAQAGMAGTRLTDTFGRYGGEEFMLILTQTRLAGAVVVAERLRAKIAGLRVVPLSLLGRRSR
jgi:diguanylate cyclase (GGDEF)-like protein